MVARLPLSAYSVPLMATLRLSNRSLLGLCCEAITEYEPPPNVATLVVELLIKREPVAGA
jgi:hypothetical protein